jgi:hypothetical protein
MTQPALYERDGDVFVPTDLTRGGWSDDTQHGGPPAGLLANAIEQVPTPVPMLVTRYTIDLFRPVPLAPLRVETRVRRGGLRVQVVEAVLRAGDLELGLASALRLRVGDFDLPVGHVHPWVDPGDPEMIDALRWNGYGDRSIRRFHYDAIEIRSVDDSFASTRPGLSWFRLLVPVIAGEETTPFVRLATLSDLANGNASALDPSEWVFINPDITLYCHRALEGEWVGMHSAALHHPAGVGLTDTWLFDRKGGLGRINQSQLIEPR